MSGPLTKTLTVDAVNTLLADYLTSVFQWEAGRVVVETRPAPPAERRVRDALVERAGTAPTRDG